MIYLPNKIERITGSLRNKIHSKIIKKGIKPIHLKLLKKINRIEAINSTEIVPINIEEYSKDLLSAVLFNLLDKSKNFYYKVSITKNRLINKKLYTSLLLNLCRNTEKIIIDTHKEKILIKAKNVDLRDNIKLIKYLNAIYFYDLKLKTIYILINAPLTDKKCIKTEKDWEYIHNPLSIVNIYLN